MTTLKEGWQWHTSKTQNRHRVSWRVSASRIFVFITRSITSISPRQTAGFSLSVPWDPARPSFPPAYTGILRWQQLDALWEIIRSQADAGWYIYAIGEEVPQDPTSGTQVKIFIDEINSLLRKEHQEDYCGVVYVDNKTEPTFIKIYDPNNLGVVCGFSDNPPLPGWIISLIKPELLDENTFTSQSRRRWWRRIFSGWCKSVRSDWTIM